MSNDMVLDSILAGTATQSTSVLPVGAKLSQIECETRLNNNRD